MDIFKWIKLSGYLLLGIIIGWQYGTIANYKAKLAYCHSDLIQDDTLIQQQNQAVIALKKAADEQQKAAREAEQKAAVIREQAKKDFNSVMTANIPANCKEAVAYGVLYVNSHQISAGF